MTPYEKNVRTGYFVHRALGYKAMDALRTAKYEATYGPTSHKRRVMPCRYDAYDGTERNDLPDGTYYTIAFQHDSDSGPPWEHCESMGVLAESHYRPGEYGEYNDWILNNKQGFYRYFRLESYAPRSLEKWVVHPAV